MREGGGGGGERGCTRERAEPEGVGSGYLDWGGVGVPKCLTSSDQRAGKVEV